MLLSSSSFESGAGLSNPPGRARLLFELQHGGAAAGGQRAGGAGAARRRSGGRSGAGLSGTEELQHHGELRRAAARGEGRLSVCPSLPLSVCGCTEACNMLIAVGYARGTISSCFAHHMSGR